MDDLRTLLETYNPETIQAIAKFQGLKQLDLPHPRLMAELVAHLSPAGRINHTVSQLAPLERTVIDEVMQRGGTALVSNLRLALLQQRQIENVVDSDEDTERPPNPYNANSKHLDDILARLTLQGLLFNLEASAPDAGRYTEPERNLIPSAHVFIPSAIREHIPPPPAPPDDAPAVVRIASSNARSFQRDLYLYWSFVRETGAKVTAKGLLYKRALAEVNETLINSEAINKRDEAQVPRLHFLRGMLHALKLLTILPSNDLSAMPDPPFFTYDLHTRSQRTFSEYAVGRFIDELTWVPGYTSLTSAPAQATTPLIVDARNLVIDHVAQIAAQQGGTMTDWVNLDTPVKRIQQTDYEFLLKRTPGSKYYSQSWRQFNPYNPQSNVLGWGFPNIKSESEGWLQVEAQFIKEIITGPLFWMGLVDLGYATRLDEDTPPNAYRMTPLGIWLLELGPQPTSQDVGGRIIVQPNFHIVALDPVSESTLAMLDQFAERLSADRAVEYQLTQKSVYGGQQAGWNVARIAEFLQEHTGTPLPSNIVRTLKEWQTKHERITIHTNVTLLHAASPADLDALLENAALAETASNVIVSQPTPTLARLNPETDLNGLFNMLYSQGQLPLLTDAEDDLPRNAIIADEEGRLRFTVPSPSLYLHRHLKTVATPDERGYTLTAESVSQAASSGMTAPQIVTALETVNTGPLPEALLRRIRAWTKYYGDAALETITLLQLRDEHTLDELLKDPEISPMLTRFTAIPDKALAHVRTSDLDELRRLLTERGIDLSSKLHKKAN